MAESQENPELVLAVDEVVDDTHSIFGGSEISSTASLRSSLLEYRHENGRTYHRYKEGKYNLPNDEKESDRLDLVHHLWLLTLDDQLGVAPPCRSTKVDRVLDVGTGTGIWAMDFGDEHPEATVFGNDLSAIMPPDAPPNVRFEVDDIEEEWTYSRPFEYIHSRLMTSSINDWSVYLRRCFENLQPGGYLELQEMDLFPRSDDGTLREDSAFLRWANFLYDASIKCGRPYVEMATITTLMNEAGFEDVTIRVFKWPSNPWPKDPKFKEIGIWNNENNMAGIEGFSMAPFTRALNWSPQEVNVFLVDVRKDINDRGIHAYWPMYCIVGRKPEISA
ncbi:Secondary metabolism regulator LAE1 [Colletotrichum orbiculare MAFF 240422]|uniref:Secondary metabolism regulator LAE1 n=2 Tax=Colletotrichum orbiculare species complex TaxID=2707354 RepID=A0A484FJF0_COLOR|nr:Secondary metabolism regulator LAE1 [Colletotrichum orbiculare MAFF 240422]